MIIDNPLWIQSLLSLSIIYFKLTPSFSIIINEVLPTEDSLLSFVEMILKLSW
jgi:hypothetical protein